MRHGWKAVAGAMGMWVASGCGVPTQPEDMDVTQARMASQAEPLEADLPRVPTEQDVAWELDMYPTVGVSALPTLNLVKFWTYERFIINGDKGIWTRPELERNLLAKAEVDECFSSIGGPISQPPCDPGTTPKRNQAYVWGLTLADRSLWFGTVANTLCLVEQGFLGATTPQENPYWVCEFGQSQSGTGDFRPPDLQRYQLNTGVLSSLNGSLPGWAELLRRTTVGLRSAGAQDGVVFLAGPSLIAGINLFAFHSETGAFLGATNLPQYNNIREWVNVRGALYTGVAYSQVVGNAPGGAVLRWRGQRSTNPAVLFNFEVVGQTDAEVANLVEHAGRIYVTTWPTFLSGGAPSPLTARFMGVWRSPRLEQDGLDDDDASQWRKVWDIRDYEPDLVAAATTGGGAVASFDGRLYWGTMHVPFLATSVALGAHAAGLLNLDADGSGSLDWLELLNTALGTHRSTSVFQSDELGNQDESVRVIYGEKYLPRYSPLARGYNIAFNDFYRNRLENPEPRWGSSGLGNFFNAYTWALEVYGNDLYLGTFDWSQVARVGLQEAIGGVTLPPMAPPAIASSLHSVEDARRAHHHFLRVLNIAIPKEGADLFRFEGRNKSAVAESLRGLGNDTNYGVRTLVSGRKALYVGTANPMNLHPDGGWELLQLKKD
ncbi:hypothetical protein MYMAC_001749 [Corallococcus macrosporus DSM 14697]|uniref:EF-hand domain-containing protein n=2 Tax=Corallococcus macrosporus TaxID=35 RepID=A0A250JRQ4_9BACT|nr:hypothetical protein MYMAC_001749 [Corallococcus macrosporus DSM 14697]